MDNTCFPGRIALLVAECLLVAGWTEEPLRVHERVQCRTRLQSWGTPGLGYTIEGPLCEGGKDTLKRPVRWLFLRQSHRGGVRCARGTPHIKHMWQEVPARWSWRSVAPPIPWAQRGDHINPRMSRGCSLCVQLQTRHRQLRRSRCLRLLDSRVNPYQSAKGRTVSGKMLHILRKPSAHPLACGLGGINGYTRSDCSPVDWTPRDVKRWQQSQCAGRLKATPRTAVCAARKGARARAR